MATATPLPDFMDSLISTTSSLPPTTTLLSSFADSAEMEPAVHHSQITFEIPSHRDLEHINTLHSFNTLLQRIGNVAYDTVASAASQTFVGAANGGGGAGLEHFQPLQHLTEQPGDQQHLPLTVTSEQISKSVVLDLSDLKHNAGGGLERFFAGADMHSIINYLWIGVVTALVILSVIFIMFSCYFYRKFREWKKCNKDIRAHLNNDMYPGGTIVSCDSLMINGALATTNETAYYQMDTPPPCYTIATGLPSYDEALLHQHQQHFSYGMKFIYPALAAVHHHPAIGGNANNADIMLTNWEKEELTLVRKGGKQGKRQQPKPQQTHKDEKPKQQKMANNAAMELELEEAPTDAGASVALLSDMAAAVVAGSANNGTYSICIEHATDDEEAFSGVVVA